MNIEPSEWGFTAYLPSGRAVAHSKDRRLLDEYCGEAPRQEPSVDRGVPASRDVVPGAGARGGSPEGAGGAPAGGAPLTSVTYTTRARSTGATVSAGRTASGWGTHCLSHGNVSSRASRGQAETLVSRPQEWCDGCREIAAGNQPKLPKNTELEDLL